MGGLLTAKLARLEFLAEAGITSLDAAVIEEPGEPFPVVQGITDIFGNRRLGREARELLLKTGSANAGGLIVPAACMIAIASARRQWSCRRRSRQT